MMSSNDVIGGAAVPLTDALPWTTSLPSSSSATKDNGIYLINDSIGASGQFLLYTLASQVLGQQQQQAGDGAGGGGGKILWLGCGPTTPSQILQGLRKLGGGRQLQQQQSKLTVRSLISELAQAWSVEADANDDNNDKDHSCSEQSFLKQVYQSIDTWIAANSKQQQQDNSHNKNHHCTNWILIDDVSALANLLGERIVYGWILALIAKRRSYDDDNNNNNKNIGLLIRCSNDQEEASLPTFAGSSVGRQQDWFGAASSSFVTTTTTTTQSTTTTTSTADSNTTISPSWERSLIELADCVLDVLPLTSGYTREIQGRIVLTRMPLYYFKGDCGRGGENDNTGEKQQQQQRKQLQSSSSSSSSSSQPPMQIINYGITDQQKIVAYIM